MTREELLTLAQAKRTCAQEWLAGAEWQDGLGAPARWRAEGARLLAEAKALEAQAEALLIAG
ncbi:hypothetical protein UFOVP347_46 [uncultured Caudovirales phage]|uniref:Uncharacterized protein n=1 Tax=uncultured Caudovirales phage TaxID=2100421 RepID=A0A6J5M266_9CAUD|nr:hypothetical protein UFOVP347_46 [uncultured Caudovirales phage]